MRTLASWCGNHEKVSEDGDGDGQSRGPLGPGDRISHTCEEISSAPGTWWLQGDIYLQCKTVNLETGLTPPQGSPWRGVQLGRWDVGVHLNSCPVLSPTRECEQAKSTQWQAGEPRRRDYVQLPTCWSAVMPVRCHWPIGQVGGAQSFLLTYKGQTPPSPPPQTVQPKLFSSPCISTGTISSYLTLHDQPSQALQSVNQAFSPTLRWMDWTGRARSGGRGGEGRGSGTGWCRNRFWGWEDFWNPTGHCTGDTLP